MDIIERRSKDIYNRPPAGKTMKAMFVGSTRPEIIKLSPIMREFDLQGLDYVFTTTGQHYDHNLFFNFITDLELKKPDYNINIGSGTQAHQTSLPMKKLEEIMIKEKPDVVIVQGDTNSVLSSALTAVKLKIPVAHVEAGLRSFDRTMPEEINRILADHCSEILFAPTETSALNLINSDIFPEKIHIVGNTVVDATRQNLEIAKKRSTITDGLDSDYLVLTLHRAENVDDQVRLGNIINALINIENEIVFPIHPRTKKMLKKYGLFEKLDKKIRIIDPVGYLDFLMLMRNAKAILTDSGGLQEEAITLNIPCITLRINTERPETVEAGGNILAGTDTESILANVNNVLTNQKVYEKMQKAKNPLGDGTTGKKITKILKTIVEKDMLKIKSSDFTHGFPKREFLEVNVKMNGKKVGEMNFTVIKVIEDKKERFPSKDMVLKKGQIIEVIK